MFPLSDSAPARRFPFFTLLLILANVFVFFKEITASDLDAFVLHYAFIPTHINFLDIHSLTPFVTAIFLHDGFLHILSNMWFLYIFGDNVEGELSPAGFLALFLISGIAGNLLQYLIMPHSDIPLIGASGAVAGILGCYYQLFPYSRIKTLVFLFFFVTIIEISAPLMLGYWFVLQIFSGATSLSHMGDQGGVAFFAHIAGFIVGLIVGNIMKKQKDSHLYD